MQDLIAFLKKLRKQLRILKKRKNLKTTINFKTGKLQVILGAGSTAYTGWIATDIPYFNILNEKHWKYYYGKRRPDKILAEHVLEHLTVEQNKKALQFAFKYLENGGVFRIAMPDENNFNNDYIEAVKPGGWDLGADDHKSFWNVDSFRQMTENIGFTVIPLEYYDSNKFFQIIKYDDTNGYIARSKKNNYVDPKIPNYTSLIVDLVKT